MIKLILVPLIEDVGTRESMCLLGFCIQCIAYQSQVQSTCVQIVTREFCWLMNLRLNLNSRFLKRRHLRGHHWCVWWVASANHSRFTVIYITLIMPNYEISSWFLRDWAVPAGVEGRVIGGGISRYSSVKTIWDDMVRLRSCRRRSSIFLIFLSGCQNDLRLPWLERWGQQLTRAQLTCVRDLYTVSLQPHFSRWLFNSLDWMHGTMMVGSYSLIFICKFCWFWPLQVNQLNG